MRVIKQVEKRCINIGEFQTGYLLIPGYWQRFRLVLVIPYENLINSYLVI
jgi:hypothetical protein